MHVKPLEQLTLESECNELVVAVVTGWSELCHNPGLYRGVHTIMIMLMSVVVATRHIEHYHVEGVGWAGARLHHAAAVGY